MPLGDDVSSLSTATDDRLTVLQPERSVVSQAGRRHADYDELESASQILESLLEADAANAKYRLATAQSHINRLLFAGRQGHFDEAEKWRLRAIEILQGLVADAPGNPDYIYRLVDTYALTEFGQHAVAASEETIGRLQRAIELAEDLVDRYPNVPEYRASLARSHIKIGEIFESLERTDDAESNYQQAVALQQTLADDFSSTPEYHVYLAQARYHLANLQRRDGRLPEALAILEKTTEDFETFAESNAGAQRGRRLLARTYRALGETLAGLDQKTLAEDTLCRAESLEESRPGRGRFGHSQSGAGRGRRAR